MRLKLKKLWHRCCNFEHMTRAFLLSLCLVLTGWLMSQTSTMAQTSGVFVLDGSPKEKNAFFAGRTEVYVDGDRLKVVEWPEETEDPSLTLATYYLGSGIVKEFAWNGERVAIVFESDQPAPRAQVNSAGELELPAPFPRLHQEAELPCGPGCSYVVRNVSFTPLDASMFAPGGALEFTFAPDAEIPLLTRDEFLDRFRIAPPDWASLH